MMSSTPKLRLSLLARFLTLAVAPASLLLGAGCNSLPLNDGGSCRVGSTLYPDGASGIKAADGCNTCSCSHGELACTLLGCPIMGQVCGGLQGLTCPAGSYCNFPSSAQCGAADATGVCSPLASACPQDYTPVCGCDGKTYGNECLAAAAGISVASNSACTPAPGCILGGVTYPEGSVNIPAGDGCNTCDCSNGALRCTLLACPIPKTCGARAGNTCTANEYCAYTEGSDCGAADAEATCMTRPSACDNIYTPVCACDGQTYANSCMAALAGSGVLHAGPCSGSGLSCVVSGVTYPDGSTNIPASDGCNICSCSNGMLSCTKKACPVIKPCGGFAGFTCGATEYCAYSEGQLCGAADASATCQPRPSTCTADVDQVCGCDGNTYSNACVAAQAGFGYSSKGACAH